MPLFLMKYYTSGPQLFISDCCLYPQISEPKVLQVSYAFLTEQKVSVFSEGNPVNELGRESISSVTLGLNWLI